MAEEIPNTFGLNTNLTNSNHWFAYFPLETRLGTSYNNIDLHIKRFSLPQMEQSSTTVSYKGYEKQIPTKVINYGTKELTIEFFVDENWRNYKALYQWMSSVEGALNPVTDEKIESISPTDYVPLRIYLLDNYKKKVIQFLFENCWIKTFNDIALEANNSGEVTASFTFCYDRFTIEDV